MGLRSHYVATGYIYDKDTARFLLIQHKKLGKWLAPGGHLEDGEEPHTGATPRNMGRNRQDRPHY